MEREKFVSEIESEESVNYKLLVFEGSGLEEGSLKVVEARPEKVISETPVIIAPGWNLTAHAMRRSLETFGNKGRRALTFDHGRKKILKSIGDDQKSIRLLFKELMKYWPFWINKRLRSQLTPLVIQREELICF